MRSAFSFVVVGVIGPSQHTSLRSASPGAAAWGGANNLAVGGNGYTRKKGSNARVRQPLGPQPPFL